MVNTTEKTNAVSKANSNQFNRTMPNSISASISKTDETAEAPAMNSDNCRGV